MPCLRRSGATATRSRSQVSPLSAAAAYPTTSDAAVATSTWRWSPSAASSCSSERGDHASLPKTARSSEATASRSAGAAARMTITRPAYGRSARATSGRRRYRGSGGSSAACPDMTSLARSAALGYSGRDGRRERFRVEQRARVLPPDPRTRSPPAGRRRARRDGVADASYRAQYTSLRRASIATRKGAPCDPTAIATTSSVHTPTTGTFKRETQDPRRDDPDPQPRVRPWADADCDPGQIARADCGVGEHASRFLGPAARRGEAGRPPSTPR